MLKVGDKVKCQVSGEIVTVKKKLGEGGQGIVYLVGSDNGDKALKWYNEQQSTDEQKTSIINLVMRGTPKGEAGKRFVWPIDVVTCEDNDNFGYLMNLIDKDKYAELGEVWAHIKPVPGRHEMCRISYELANSYRELHLEGYCYRDISEGNLMFNVDTGEVLICDNDNVGINRQSKCQVQGTWEYMAPEIIMGKATPSTLTDLYSLAVLLFRLWIWHHPLHGEIEYNIRSWDIPAKKKVYGEEPIFVFDSHNMKNKLPNDPEYSTPRKLWEHCPEPLKNLFIKSFTEGLHNPDKRVTEGEWQELFLELDDCIVACSKDKAENFWYSGIQDFRCWYCKAKIDNPIRLKLKAASGTIREMVLNKDTKVLERHINLYGDEGKKDNVIGEIVQNPNNPSMWGLKNLTQNIWKIIKTDGTECEVVPSRSVAISLGIKIDFGTGSIGEFEK